MPPLPLIFIGGPTASGKSSFALRLAKECKGWIINADAMQVYKDLPLLTAQPSEEDKAEIPHLLYEITDPSEASSAGKWLHKANRAIEETRASGHVPILVGGTGLYFSSLLGGLSEIPDIPPETRKEVENLYEELGEKKFRALLSRHDPLSATRIERNDRQRLIRAYEVFLHTKKPLGDWHKKKNQQREAPSVDYHLLTPDRQALYEACDKRFLMMIEKGAIEEVKKIMSRELPLHLPALKILGVREITSYLKGEVSLEAAIKKAQQMTRNYAKRQMTWFRNQWIKT